MAIRFIAFIVAALLPIVAAASGGDHGGGHHGIDWWGVGSMYINVAILLLVGRLAAGTSLRLAALAKHEEVAKRLAEAKRLLDEAERAKTELAAKLAALESSRDAEIERYRAEAHVEAEKILADARHAVDRLFRDAETSVENRLRAATADLRSHIADQVVKAAEERIRRDLSKQAVADAAVDRAVARLGGEA